MQITWILAKIWIVLCLWSEKIFPQAEELLKLVSEDCNVNFSVIVQLNISLTLLRWLMLFRVNTSSSFSLLEFASVVSSCNYVVLSFLLKSW